LPESVCPSASHRTGGRFGRRRPKRLRSWHLAHEPKPIPPPFLEAIDAHHNFIGRRPKRKVDGRHIRINQSRWLGVLRETCRPGLDMRSRMLLDMTDDADLDANVTRLAYELKQPVES